MEVRRELVTSPGLEQSGRGYLETSRTYKDCKLFDKQLFKFQINSAKIRFKHGLSIQNGEINKSSSAVIFLRVQLV